MVNGRFVLLVTVFAMARTSSRLKAIGLTGAFCFSLRILSRKAVFLDGFSMEGGRALATAGAGLGAGADFRAEVGDFLGAGRAAFATGFFAGVFFLFFAMGRVGGGSESG